MGAAPLTPSAAPTVTRKSITFGLEDADHRWRKVHLFQEIERPRSGPPLGLAGDLWTLTWARPAADRVEYLFEVDDGNGPMLIPDPSNPLRAGGPFGDKSVIEFPEYRPPDWVDDAVASGATIPLPIQSPLLRSRLDAFVWGSASLAAGEPAPLLVVHDGPEYAEHSALVAYLESMVAAGRVPPLRAALLPPVRRDHTYSASAVYGRALVHEILPALEHVAPTPHGRRGRIGMGASLGGLAMLHAHRTFPESFGALFLQSGSFFRQRYDPQESGFVRFRRIARFVGKVLNTAGWAHHIPVTITCGTAEENLANNRAMAMALARQGYDTVLHEHRDAHNWTSWRDCLDPALTALLQKAWG